MGKRGKSRKRLGKKKLDGDLDRSFDEYEPSESEEEFGKEEKILLDNRRGMKKDDDESEEEVFGIHSSSDEDEEEEENKFYGKNVGSDMDSDIEGKGSDGDSEAGLPDSKAWGKNSGRYYNTDYVDKDFGGMSKDDEELADMEEEEAANIQKRLLSHMEETDFTMGLLDKVKEKMADNEEKSFDLKASEKITSDLSHLSRTEKIQLLKQESPELFQLIDDFSENMALAKDKLLPVLNLIKERKISSCPASNFVQTLFSVILNYSMNIIFYLLLKSKRTGPVDDHPVVHRLFTYKKVLDEMLIVLEEQLINQIDCIIKTDKENGELKLTSSIEKEESVAKNRAERRKRKLKILEDTVKTEKMIMKKKTKLEARMNEDIIDDINSDLEEEDNKLESEESEGDDDANGKRAITYEMKKNKGLTPRRKKEDRNPRVKNKNKYRKAKIRRKGQVREVRTEVQKYGGEIFGLKAHLSKSISIKS